MIRSTNHIPSFHPPRYKKAIDAVELFPLVIFHEAKTSVVRPSHNWQAALGCPPLSRLIFLHRFEKLTYKSNQHRHGCSKYVISNLLPDGSDKRVQVISRSILSLLDSKSYNLLQDFIGQIVCILAQHWDMLSWTLTINS